MEKEKQERITLYLNKILKKKIEEGARNEKRSVTNFILFHIEEYFEKQKVKKNKK